MGGMALWLGGGVAGAALPIQPFLNHEREP